VAERTPQGYLPADRPPTGALVSLGFQHVLTMFPATALVALLTGFDVQVTIFASGLATVIALLASGMRIPMYYGSSFSYIAAVRNITFPGGATTTSNALVQQAQVGIVGTAVVNIIAGLIVRAVGKARLDRVLPPVVTGSVAVVIGIALGIPFGILIGLNRTVSEMFYPILNFFQSISGIALLPIVMIWWGTTEKTVFAVVLYFALRSGLVTLSVESPTDQQLVFFYATLAFIAGFSERRARVLLGGATKILGDPDEHDEDKDRRRTEKAAEGSTA